MIFSNFGGSGLALRPILRISGAVVSFPPKNIEKGTCGPPPKASIDPLFAGSRFGCFFGVFSFLDFSDFECPEAPFWLPF